MNHYIYPENGDNKVYREPKPDKETNIYIDEDDIEKGYKPDFIMSNTDELENWQRSKIGQMAKQGFKVGDVVYHAQCGKGTILEIRKTGIPPIVVRLEDKRRMSTYPNFISHFYPGQKIERNKLVWVEERIKVEFETFVTTIDRLEDIIEVDFNGHLKVKFEKQDNNYIAINSMNGWGNNNIEEMGGKQLNIVGFEWQEVPEPKKEDGKYLDYEIVNAITFEEDLAQFHERCTKEEPDIFLMKKQKLK